MSSLAKFGSLEVVPKTDDVATRSPRPPNSKGARGVTSLSLLGDSPKDLGDVAKLHAQSNTRNSQDKFSLNLADEGSTVSS